MVAFAIGGLAILADLALFASGQRNLPVWLNILCMLAPLGLGLGLIGVLREARSSSRSVHTSPTVNSPDTNPRESNPDTAGAS